MMQKGPVIFILALLFCQTLPGGTAPASLQDHQDGSIAILQDPAGTSTALLQDPAGGAMRSLADRQLLSPDSAYAAANVLYATGQFESALNLYGEIVAGGSESADLYYNMGNAAFRSNNIGYAILYYEKALKLDPGHEDAAHNLEYVSRYRVDTFEEVPEFFLRTWTKTLVRSFSERTWSILSLVFFILILGSILAYLFSRRLGLKKAGFAATLVFLLFFAVSIAAAYAQYNRITTPEAGIILSPSVVVRSSPSESGTELFILHEGTKVTVEGEVSGWQNIRVVDGREGWIPVTDFDYI